MADEDLVTRMMLMDREPHGHPCEACLDSKQTHEVICKEVTSHADHTLGCVFSDMCGPLPTLSHKGFKYFVTFIDNKAHYISISPLKEKSWESTSRHLSQKLNWTLGTRSKFSTPMGEVNTL